MMLSADFGLLCYIVLAEEGRKRGGRVDGVGAVAHIVVAAVAADVAVDGFFFTVRMHTGARESTNNVSNSAQHVPRIRS